MIKEYVNNPKDVFKTYDNFLQLESLTKQRIRTPKKIMLETANGCKILARQNIYDYNIIVEQFLQNQYFPQEVFRDYAPKTIIDIGAYINDFGLYCASTFNSTVHAYEPVKQNFTIAIENQKINNYNITTFNEGVATTPTLDINVKDVQGEIHASSHRTYKKGFATKEIKCVSLDTAIERLGKHIDVLKIDCEGQEADILNRNDFNQLSKNIDYIIFETHSFIDDDVMQDIYHKLQKGFELVYEKHAVKWYRSKQI